MDVCGAFLYGVLELILAPQTSVTAVCVILFFTGICYIQWGATALVGTALLLRFHDRSLASALAPAWRRS